MSEPILEVKDLKVSFHSKGDTDTAVNGVEFTLMPGETLGIVGESGCGKSVTSMSILKLLPERTSSIDKSSSIRYKGEELTTKSNRQMCEIRGNDIAMIFQDSMTSLNPTMTVGKQMTEIFMNHQKLGKKEAWKQATEMLRKVGIPSPEIRMKEHPHQLSGGMRQRVMIAMALSCRPAVLIADEPTTALDVTVQAQILRMMRELQSQMNMAIMLITHDMGVLAEMADRIMVMYAGNVVESATREQIFREPMHPYTKGLLASIPKISSGTERLYAIEGMVPGLKDMPKGCRFCDRCSQCMPECREQNPELYRVNGRQVRCFLYRDQAVKGGAGHE